MVSARTHTLIFTLTLRPDASEIAQFAVALVEFISGRGFIPRLHFGVSYLGVSYAKSYAKISRRRRR